MFNEPLPEVPEPCPKNSRCPTMLSTDRYAQITVGVVSLSHAIHTEPLSTGMCGLVRVVRASFALAVPVQNREPQSGVVTLRTGSPVVAAIAALGNSADDPTPTTGMLCALLPGTINTAIARISIALQIFHRVINILLFSIRLFFLVSLTRSFTFSIAARSAGFFGTRVPDTPAWLREILSSSWVDRAQHRIRLCFTPLMARAESQPDGNWHWHLLRLPWIFFLDRVG